MATSVRLDFVSPETPGLTQLEIYEGPTKTGPFTLIETVSGIGTVGAYISEYTTSLATNALNWFAIRWVDNKGARTAFSQAVQGNQASLVKKLKDRIILRDPTMPEAIAVQEAEYVIFKVLGATDPYDPTLTATPDQLEGMTLWGLARSKVHSALSSASSESYTAGLVSQKSSQGSAANEKLIQWLLDEANKVLGIGTAYVMLLEDIDPTGNGAVSLINYDQSRLAITLTLE